MQNEVPENYKSYWISQKRKFKIKKKLLKN